MKLVFCGYGRAGQECLLSILASEKLSISEILVFTHDKQENREFIEFLKSIGMNFFFESVNSKMKLLKEFDPTIIVSAYYRFIIREEVLSLVEGKAINIHPSLLPKYKGCFSSAWALLNNECETGITFHYMSKTIDEGNILRQLRYRIKEFDTAYSLYHKLISIAVANIVDVIVDVLVGAVGEKQYSLEDSYYKRALPFDGEILWRDNDQEFCERFIRAMYFPPYPFAKIRFEDKQVESFGSVNDFHDFLEKRGCDDICI